MNTGTRTTSRIQTDPAENDRIEETPQLDESYFNKLLDGPTYLKCFGVSNSNNQAGTDAIFLNSERLPSPTLRAVAVAHELVHVEHSHKDTPRGQHNVFRHLFVSEEGEAHLSDQEAAKALHTHSLNSPVETYLFDVLPLPIACALCILTTYLIRVISAGSSQSHRRLPVSAQLPL